MTIAIVGAAGQVGRGLLAALAREGQPTFGITRNDMAAAPLLADGYDIRVGSVADATRGRELLSGADVVVNAALEIDRPKRARARNEALISALLDHAPRAVIVHLSSVAVYGSCVDASVSTFERPRPDATYGREKLHLERYALEAAQRLGRTLVILRLGHVYGPGQGISKEIFDVLSEDRWALPFGGELPSNAVHIDHLAAAIPGLSSGAPGGRVINAIDNPQRTWRTLYDMHAQAAGYAAAASMGAAESRRLQDRFRRRARMGLAERVPAEIASWVRQLPLKSLADVTAVRQATEAALLALPPQVERLVDRKYAVVSARHHVGAATATAAQGAPPWYYSEAIPGPGLQATFETAARTTQQIEALRRWHAAWAAPAWRVNDGLSAHRS